MATYAQVSDVRALAPSITINATTSPSEGQVQTYLDLIEVEINAILTNLGITTVPVDATASPLSWAWLKDVVATGALAKLLFARALGVDVSLLEQAKQARAIYESKIKCLKNPDDPFSLPDADTNDLSVPKTPDQRSASFVDEGFDDFDLDAPRVTRAQAF